MADKNYTLGRGKILLAPFKTGTKVPDGFEYVGNSPELSLTFETETLDHYNSDEGIREKDQSAELQTNRTGSYILDDIMPTNLARFFLGSTSVLAQASATAEVDTITVLQGRFYQLGEGTDNAISGARSVTVTTVEDSGGMGSTYDVGDDYIVHADIGMIEIVEGGGISDATELDITYDLAAVSRNQTISGSSPVEGAMRYIEYNPVGEDKTFLMPYVKVRPNGDFNLKTDDWQQLPFSLEILKLANAEALYVDGKPFTP